MSISKEPVIDYDEFALLLRLEAAMRARNYVKEYAVGDDLGIKAEALTVVQCNKLLKELDDIRGNEDDGKFAYEIIVMENTEPSAPVSAGAPDTLDDLP